MSYPRPSADGRDERAADRDDAADERDDTARDRDDVAGRRDTDATNRDAQARRDSDDLLDRFQRTCEQILGRFVRIEDATIDSDDWSDLTPDALARLDAYIAEQRRLAGRDRDAVTALLNRLRTDLNHARQDRQAAAEDRQASASDRQHSAGNRRDSGQDRSDSARDRAQSAIEREQVDSSDLSADCGVDPPGPEVDDHVLRTRPLIPTEGLMAISRQLISDSRDRIARARSGTPPATGDAPSRNSPATSEDH